MKIIWLINMLICLVVLFFVLSPFAGELNQQGMKRELMEIRRRGGEEGEDLMSAASLGTTLTVGLRVEDLDV